MVRAFLFLLIGGIACDAKLASQSPEEREFTDPQGKYRLLLRDRWEPVTYQDGAGNTVTDIIYNNSEEGLLRIRHFKVDPHVTPSESAARDEETAFRFRPGFVRGALEPFGGSYPGSMVLSFEFTHRGKRKLARYYYLKTDETTLYVLQFEGRAEVLRSIRNRTDLIARSFKALSP
jgi:hypothetical protein